MEIIFKKGLNFCKTSEIFYILLISIFLRFLFKKLSFHLYFATVIEIISIIIIGIRKEIFLNKFFFWWNFFSKNFYIDYYLKFYKNLIFIWCIWIIEFWYNKKFENVLYFFFKVFLFYIWIVLLKTYFADDYSWFLILLYIFKKF